jgi:hypothetical protein
MNVSNRGKFPGSASPKATRKVGFQPAWACRPLLASLKNHDFSPVERPRRARTPTLRAACGGSKTKSARQFAPLTNVIFDAGLLAAIDDEAMRRGLTCSGFLARVARETIEGN